MKENAQEREASLKRMFENQRLYVAAISTPDMKQLQDRNLTEYEKRVKIAEATYGGMQYDTAQRWKLTRTTGA